MKHPRKRKQKQAEVTGAVVRIDATGIGPNSGELTISIKPYNGDLVQVFAGIMPERRDQPHIPENHNADILVHGVYASYVTIATAALTSGRTVLCRYVIADKLRISQLSIFQ